MFISHPNGAAPHTYAIVDRSMSCIDYPQTEDLTVYQFKGYWFVRDGENMGGLAYGKLSVWFLNNFAEKLNQRSDYKNLTVQEVLEYAEDLPAVSDSEQSFKRVRPKKVIAHPEAVFGNRKAWSNSVEDKDFRNLVNAWFDLPNLPLGTSGWVKLLDCCKVQS